jgi:biotin carboxyl carrier protein
MNIIAGTGNSLHGNIIYLLIFTILGAGCHTPDVPADNGKAVAIVSAVNPGRALIENTEQFPAVSLYLQKNLITSPVAGYVTEVKVRLGDSVQKGQLLYVMETQERHAMFNDTLQLKNYGIISVKAPATGIVSTVAIQQSGDFVVKGNILCTIATANSIAFRVNVPYELKRFIHMGQSCRIVLPDGTGLTAIIAVPLTQITQDAQTQPYLARIRSTVFLPENLIGTAQIVTYHHADAQLLPRQCVLSDELMHHYWVMKAINDSVAVKVPVQPGQRNDSLIEIMSPVFSPADRILLEGNYGLSDTAAIKIQ